MHCSSFKPLFDDFVDGTLAPAQSAGVVAHVDTCDECRALLEELRVVDALLLVPRQVDPAPNFTFRTMADVRSLPPPRPHRTPALWVVVSYLAFAWLVIGGWFVLGGQAPHATLGLFGSLLTQYSASVAGLAGVTSHVFGRSTPDVGVAAGVILALDVALAAMLVVAWAIVRPRVFARAQARAPEGTP